MPFSGSQKTGLSALGTPGQKQSFAAKEEAEAAQLFASLGNLFARLIIRGILKAR